MNFNSCVPQLSSSCLGARGAESAGGAVGRGGSQHVGKEGQGWRAAHS